MTRYHLILIVITLMSSHILSAREYSESYYQDLFCKKPYKKEFVLTDSTRVDCLTDEHAIEIDFAGKWYEAIGQSLHYARMTNKKAGIAIILEKQGDISKLLSLRKVIKHYSLPIEVFRIQSGIFKKRKIASNKSSIIKLSRSGICHTSTSRSYSRTKHYTPFKTIEECLKKGRLPKR